jgi:hypothetical protein
MNNDEENENAGVGNKIGEIKRAIAMWTEEAPARSQRERGGNESAKGGEDAKGAVKLRWWLKDSRRVVDGN